MKKEGNNLEGMPSAENSINFTEKKNKTKI